MLTNKDTVICIVVRQLSLTFGDIFSSFLRYIANYGGEGFFQF